MLWVSLVEAINSTEVLVYPPTRVDASYPIFPTSLAYGRVLCSHPVLSPGGIRTAHNCFSPRQGCTRTEHGKPTMRVALQLITVAWRGPTVQLDTLRLRKEPPCELRPCFPGSSTLAGWWNRSLITACYFHSSTHVQILMDCKGCSAALQNYHMVRSPSAAPRPSSRPAPCAPVKPFCFSLILH